jgi:hypothetical protein
MLRRQAGAFQLQVVVDRIARIPEGHLIDVVMTPWWAIYREINRDPGFMYRLTSLQLEELIAGPTSLRGSPA